MEALLLKLAAVLFRSASEKERTEGEGGGGRGWLARHSTIKEMRRPHPLGNVSMDKE